MIDLAGTPQISQHRACTDKTALFSDPLKLYLQAHYISGSTEATQRFYDKELGLFFRDIDGVDDPAGITRIHIMGHMQRMKERGLAPRRIRTRLQPIALSDGWC